MIRANLIIHTGDDSIKHWHKLISDFYAAIDDANPIEAIGLAFDKYEALVGNKVRWEIIEVETSRTLIANDGRKHGQSMTFPFTLLNHNATNFLFGLNKWAYGENRNIIGHLLSINGKIKLWKPWDPRILSLSKKGDGTVSTWPVGFDIITEAETKFSDKPGDVLIKPFMGADTFARFNDLVGNSMFYGEGEKLEHAGIWMMLKQATANQQKKHVDYTFADLVRVTVGDLPRDVKVDSTDVKQ